MSLPRDKFVNPYTFVPFPAGVLRGPRRGHDRPRPGTWSGTLQVTWRLETPLLLPERAVEEEWITRQSAVVIPGSSLKGALRSLHEVMFNGCLRVVDDEFVPSYRDPVSAGGVIDEHHQRQEWFVALVTGVTEERVSEVEVCNEVEFVESTALARAYEACGAGLPTTGDVVPITGDRRQVPVRGSLNEVTRAQISDVPRRPNGPEDVEELLAGVQGRRVLLVTDTSARKTQREDRSPASCFWAAGVLGQRHRLTVPRSVADLLRRSLEQTRDVQKARAARRRQGAAPALHEDVTWHGVVVGRRRVVTVDLRVGDVVWVRITPDADEVSEIKLSQVWRHPGRGNLAKRLPDSSLLPCSHEQSLCLTCRLFGSADVSGETTPGEQNSYAGHVRFGAARSIGPVETTPISVAPRGAPKLGAGSFSLEPVGLPGGRRPPDVAAHWGSAVEEPSHPRKLRGRKFYWNVDPDEQARQWSQELHRTVMPRYKIRPGQRDTQTTTGLLVPPTTVFTSTIVVENIDDFELKTVLAVIDPAVMLEGDAGRPGDTYRVRWGGGKPFGLGAVRGNVVAVELIRQPEDPSAGPAGRYGGGVVVTELPSWDGGDEAAYEERCGGRVHLPALARVLAEHGLGAEEYLVSYPPGATWDQVDEKEFDQNFRFFQLHNGEQFAGDTQTWTTLPVVTRAGGERPSQVLPVAPKGRRRG